MTRPQRNQVTRFLASLTLATLLVSGLNSCAVKRELSIRSFPPGALVRVDDEVVGLTPVTFEFLDYGSRLVTFYKDGYRTQSTRIRLKAPWYLRFPVDLVSELLLPFGWSDRREMTIELSPESGTVERPDFQLVRARAERLRRAGPEGPKPLEITTVDLAPVPTPKPTVEEQP